MLAIAVLLTVRVREHASIKRGAERPAGLTPCQQTRSIGAFPFGTTAATRRYRSFLPATYMAALLGYSRACEPARAELDSGIGANRSKQNEAGSARYSGPGNGMNLETNGRKINLLGSNYS